jgi:hypothetical protein
LHLTTRTILSVLQIVVLASYTGSTVYNLPACDCSCTAVSLVIPVDDTV